MGQILKAGSRGRRWNARLRIASSGRNLAHGQVAEGKAFLAIRHPTQGELQNPRMSIKGYRS